jgi:hypothetical protein
VGGGGQKEGCFCGRKDDQKQETLVKAAWLLLKPPLLKPLVFLSNKKQPMCH